VALAEHKGVLTTYAREPVAETSVSVGEDVWVIEQVVPYQGRWAELTEPFMKDCVAQVLARHNKPWRTNLPTTKQLAYLRALGYEGPEPKTKGEAGALIGEYKAKKGRE
jgi:hypothetical protein